MYMMFSGAFGEADVIGMLQGEKGIINKPQQAKQAVFEEVGLRGGGCNNIEIVLQLSL